MRLNAKKRVGIRVNGLGKTCLSVPIRYSSLFGELQGLNIRYSLTRSCVVAKGYWIYTPVQIVGGEH